MEMIFKQKELPFILILFVGVLGFLLTKTIESVAFIPAIEYNEKVSRTDKCQVEYIIRNITIDQKFKDLMFFVIADNSDIEKVSLPQYIAPGYSAKNPVKPSPITPSSWKIPIGPLQPKTSVSFTVLLSKEYEQNTHLHLTSDNPIQLMHRSFKTILIMCQFEIILVLAILLFIGVAIYLICYQCSLKREDKK